MDKGFDIMKKVVIVGGTGVGKTSMMTRFALGKFVTKYYVTIGVDFTMKLVKKNGTKVKLQIWDIAGHERFGAITACFYKGASGALIVFDLTNDSSLNDAEKWYEEVKRFNEQKIYCILVGAKSDLKTERKVEANQVQELANKLGMPYIEVSSKLDENINQCFDILTGKMISHEDTAKKTPPSASDKESPKEEKKIDYQKEAHETKQKLQAISDIIKRMAGDGNPTTEEIRKVLNSSPGQKIVIDESGKAHVKQSLF